MPNPIPPITDPLGMHWQQPDTEGMEFTDQLVQMSKEQFKLLKRYDRTLPSSVYEGKMWKCSASLSQDYLKWFYPHPTDKGLMSVGTLVIVPFVLFD